ncbi:unnamed protein product [Cuscuta epithymum]|nr:unnamed protein product [Cuscuta epithymum]
MVEDHGVVCSHSKFEDSVIVESISSHIFQEDLFLNGYLSSPIGLISSSETKYMNRDIVILKDDDLEGMFKKSGEERSNVEEIMQVTPIQVSFPEQSQHKAIKGGSQLGFEDASDGEPSEYDSDQELFAPTIKRLLILEEALDSGADPGN